MYCERCGRFCLFKKLCSDCALLETPQHAEAPAPSGTGLLKTLGSKLGTRIATTSTISISLNGKKAVFNLSSGITDSLVRQVAEQANLTPEEARALLQAQGSPERMLEVGNKIAQSHRLGAVKCPGCGREVPPGKFCSECGHTLP